MTFGDTEIEKYKFYSYFLENVDIDNVLVSNKISFGEEDYKYFIGYLYDDYKIKSLHVMLLKTNAKSYVNAMMGRRNGFIF